MNEYKYYAIVDNGKVTELVQSHVRPKEVEDLEVLELTVTTFIDLAYGESY